MKTPNKKFSPQQSDTLTPLHESTTLAQVRQCLCYEPFLTSNEELISNELGRRVSQHANHPAAMIGIFELCSPFKVLGFARVVTRSPPASNQTGIILIVTPASAVHLSDPMAPGIAYVPLPSR